MQAVWSTSGKRQRYRVCDTPSSNLDCQAQHPLERAAEHCLAARKAIQELPEPLLHRMSDMLLLEVGRALSKLADERYRGAMN
jgi:hypothetical protein